jgi:hypothetical protein
VFPAGARRPFVRHCPGKDLLNAALRLSRSKETLRRRRRSGPHALFRFGVTRLLMMLLSLGVSIFVAAEVDNKDQRGRMLEDSVLVSSTTAVRRRRDAHSAFRAARISE